MKALKPGTFRYAQIKAQRALRRMQRAAKTLHLRPNPSDWQAAKPLWAEYWRRQRDYQEAKAYYRALAAHLGIKP